MPDLPCSGADGLARGKATPLSRRTADAIIELLGRERLMTLACLGPEGSPEATTVGYLDKGLHLYFVIARSSRQFANLQADGRASVAIRREIGAGGGGVGLSMVGQAAEMTDPEILARLNHEVAERYPDVHVYCPAGDSVAVMRFTPRLISAAGVAGGRSGPETFVVEAGWVAV